MKPVAFDYARPETLEEALDLMAAYGDDAAPLAGGLSLGPMLNLRLARPAVVVDLGKLGLTAIRETAETMTVGALTRQAVFKQRLASELSLPMVADALDHIGHYQTRARGTVGGSLAHADPAAELPLCLATLGGTVTLQSRDGARTLSAEDFFDDALMTNRRSDELLVETAWPKAAAGTGCAFDEFALRHGDFAIVAAAATVTLDDSGNMNGCRIGFGGIEGRPHLVSHDAVAGEPVTDALIEAMIEPAVGGLDPAGDHVADARYRLALARTLGRRVLGRAAERAALNAAVPA